MEDEQDWKYGCGYADCFYCGSFAFCVGTIKSFLSKRKRDQGRSKANVGRTQVMESDL